MQPTMSLFLLLPFLQSISCDLPSCVNCKVRLNADEWITLFFQTCLRHKMYYCIHDNYE